MASSAQGRDKPQRSTVGLVILLALAAIVGGRTLRVRAMDDYLASQTYEDVYYVPPPQWLHVFSLGHDEALADLLWVKGLVYFGDEITHRGAVSHSLHYADAIVALDPNFRKAYRWAGVVGMYRPVDVTTDDIRASIAFLERGVRQFPDDGEMAWDLGASLAYELGPRLDDPDEKQRIMLRAVEHMEVAARQGGGPPWLALSNASQLMQLGQTEQAIRHLEEMHATVQDEDTRAQIEAQLARLRGEAHAEAFRRAHEELERERLVRYPWIPTQLYIHLRDPEQGAPDDSVGDRWLPAVRQLGTSPQ